MTAARLAVIDIGSNTANVAVYASAGPGHLDRVFDASEPLRLMRRLGADGRLPDAAVERLLETLREFRDMAFRNGATQVIALATSAVRDARNADVVARVAAQEVGVPLRVVDGPEEGRLAGLATLRLLPVRDGLMFDLGGGSVQLVELRDGVVARAASLLLGALRLTDRFAVDAPMTADAVLALRDHVDAELATLPWLRDTPGPLVGVGGTVRALAKVERRRGGSRISHGHGQLLAGDAVTRTWEIVSRSDATRRREIPGLAAHRNDTIMAGALVVDRILAARGAEHVRINSYGVREGAALDAWRPEGGWSDDPLRAELAGRFPGDEGPRGWDRAYAALGRADADVRREVGDAGGPLHAALGVAGWLQGVGGVEVGVLAGAPTGKDRPLHGAVQESVLAAVDLLSEAPVHGMAEGTHRRLRGLLTRRSDG
jgi:exopolyphosphatase/guanosine-5'-triphosphate,3'-diphosphate pyrophosphatase